MTYQRFLTIYNNYKYSRIKFLYLNYILSHFHLCNENNKKSVHNIRNVQFILLESVFRNLLVLHLQLYVWKRSPLKPPVFPHPSLELQNGR